MLIFLRKYFLTLFWINLIICVFPFSKIEGASMNPTCLSVSETPDLFNPYFEKDKIEISAAFIPDPDEKCNKLSLSIEDTSKNWEWENTNFTITRWDGKNGNGEIVSGTYPYEVICQYSESSSSNNSFQLFSSGTITVLPIMGEKFSHYYTDNIKERFSTFNEFKEKYQFNFASLIISNTSTPLKEISPHPIVLQNGKILLAKLEFKDSLPSSEKGYSGAGLKIETNENKNYFLGFCTSQKCYGKTYLFNSLDEGKTWQLISSGDYHYAGWMDKYNNLFLWIRVEDIGSLPWKVKFLSGLATSSDEYEVFYESEEIILSKVLISEVYYNVAKDKGKEGDNEWVIIHNLEDKEIDLSGWKICSKNKEEWGGCNIWVERCNELSGKIPAKGFAIITPTSTTFNYWEIPNNMTKIILNEKFGSYGLNNEGDNLILKFGEEIIDELSYGKDNSIFDPPCQEVKEGNSLLRVPLEKDTDTAQDFIESEPTIKKNQAPVSIINFSPKNPIKEIEVKFDASNSTDTDGYIINFQWQIKNASTSEILATSSATTTSFVFQENGNYEITLIATDNEGATSSTSTILKIEPFSFAIITDLHIGRGYDDYDSEGFDDFGDGQDYYLTERLKNVVQWIINNRNNIQCENATCSIKFLAILGDITDTAEKSEFCKVKEILDVIAHQFGNGLVE